MAVDAQHMNLFSPQLITQRDFVKSGQGNGVLYNTQMESCIPLMDTMQQAQQQLWAPPFQPLVSDQVPANTSMNDSGLTYNIPAVNTPRKRQRDIAFSSGYDQNCYPVSQKNKLPAVSSFLDQEIISQIHNQQQELDRFLSEHTEKLRMEIEERRKRQSRMLIAAIQERVVKKMKEKDEEISRIGKLNWVLQEKVKSLSVENQLWRDLAQTNEATANSLRSNLEQVLAHVSEDRQQHHVINGAEVADDCESSCGSSDYGRETAENAVSGGGGGGGCGGSRACRKCGERESSVLLLPCRHLCLCAMCGSSLVGTCPVCDSVLNASLHVNMS